MIYGFNNYNQLHRITDFIPSEYPLITSADQALKYLYFLDRTLLDNANSTDIINYELLVYLELYFADNIKVQSLIKNIKSNIYNNFVMKTKFIKRLTDDLCSYRNLGKFFHDDHFENLLLKGEKDCNEKI